jgi:hypothetical protein
MITSAVSLATVLISHELSNAMPRSDPNCASTDLSQMDGRAAVAGSGTL